MEQSTIRHSNRFNNDYFQKSSEDTVVLLLSLSLSSKHRFVCVGSLLLYVLAYGFVYFLVCVLICSTNHFSDTN